MAMQATVPSSDITDKLNQSGMKLKVNEGLSVVVDDLVEKETSPVPEEDESHSKLNCSPKCGRSKCVHDSCNCSDAERSSVESLTRNSGIEETDEMEIDDNVAYSRSMVMAGKFSIASILGIQGRKGEDGITKEDEQLISHEHAGSQIIRDENLLDSSQFKIESKPLHPCFYKGQLTRKGNDAIHNPNYGEAINREQSSKPLDFSKSLQIHALLNAETNSDYGKLLDSHQPVFKNPIQTMVSPGSKQAPNVQYPKLNGHRPANQSNWSSALYNYYGDAAGTFGPMGRQEAANLRMWQELLMCGRTSGLQNLGHPYPVQTRNLYLQQRCRNPIQAFYLYQQQQQQQQQHQQRQQHQQQGIHQQRKLMNSTALLQQLWAGESRVPSAIKNGSNVPNALMESNSENVRRNGTPSPTDEDGRRATHDTDTMMNNGSGKQNNGSSIQEGNYDDFY